MVEFPARSAAMQGAIAVYIRTFTGTSRETADAMTQDQAVILALLLASFVMFLWGKWRHDMVAMGVLLVCVAAGLVPGAEAFAGFGHPAVITVACVLVLSSGLQSSGAVDVLTRIALPRAGRPTLSIAALTALAAALSAFMNNVGALALLMPAAVQIAGREGLPPGKLLMPLAFGSILGGMTTLVGTPPNLIVSGFRIPEGAPDGSSGSANGFAMFDFAPVGVAVALAGVVFLVVFSRWLVPSRQRMGAEGFETGAYVTEARVTTDSKAAGQALRDLDRMLEEADARVVGLVRDEVPFPTPHRYEIVRDGDILTIEAGPEGLATALSALELKLEEDVPHKPDPEPAQEDAATAPGPRPVAVPATEARPAAQTGDIALMEMAVLPNSPIVGRSATDIHLRSRHAINLLAISRQGQRSMTRLRTMAIRAGDVLLVQGPPDALAEFAPLFACVPLAERPLRIPDPRQSLMAGGILAASVGMAATGMANAAVAFAAGVLAAMALRVVSPRGVYNAVDWPVIVLLGALIPVAGAMETTGTADLIARLLLEHVAGGHAIIALGLILVITMTLSDFMNNAATAAVMCPIGIQTAGQLAVSADPFLMAVAIGASCAFLTPIGHQNNTLILGPGGFRFGDYWRLGLPLEIIVVAVAMPMLLLVWPL
jgi:di/tricarboxylate transporter